MGRVIPLQGRKTRRRNWTRADDYRALAPRQKRRAAARTGRSAKRPQTLWFPIVLLALPTAAFSAVLFVPSLDDGPDAAAAAVPFAAPLDMEQAHFPLCGSGQRITCVVDGDTIWYQGTKIRIADIDTPEVSSPGCVREARLGGRATQRLQTLLNAGAFTLAPNPDGRDTDRYGRSLQVVTRRGHSLGDALVDEGLAQRWGGPRIAWCLGG